MIFHGIFVASVPEIPGGNKAGAGFFEDNPVPRESKTQPPARDVSRVPQSALPTRCIQSFFSKLSAEFLIVSPHDLELQ
jgi:hypothetical protein